MNTIMTYDAQHRRVVKHVVSRTRQSTRTTVDSFVWYQWMPLRRLTSEINAPTLATVDPYGNPVPPNIYGGPFGVATTTYSHQDYVWGRDASGSLQGAGGVGGLVMITAPDPAFPYLDNAGYGGVPPRYATWFPTYDHNGNIRAYVRDAAPVTPGQPGPTLPRVDARFEYDAFGNELRATGPLASTLLFRFSTKYLDTESGLSYYGYRFYSAAQGRWINRDPIGERGGVNLYGMVGNDPVERVDVLGNNPAAGAAVGVAGGTALAEWLVAIGAIAYISDRLCSGDAIQRCKDRCYDDYVKDGVMCRSFSSPSQRAACWAMIALNLGTCNAGCQALAQ
jgi:RHS repeat-associated protein